MASLAIAMVIAMVVAMEKNIEKKSKKLEFHETSKNHIFRKLIFFHFFIPLKEVV